MADEKVEEKYCGDRVIFCPVCDRGYMRLEFARESKKWHIPWAVKYPRLSKVLTFWRRTKLPKATARMKQLKEGNK